LAAPTAHPDSGEPRIVGSIFSLADAGATLAARAAEARARATEAASARERVSAAIAAYRLEASFDQALTGAYRQVTALMEERGLRTGTTCRRPRRWPRPSLRCRAGRT